MVPFLWSGAGIFSTTGCGVALPAPVTPPARGASCPGWAGSWGLEVHRWGGANTGVLHITGALTAMPVQRNGVVPDGAMAVPGGSFFNPVAAFLQYGKPLARRSI